MGTVMEIVVSQEQGRVPVTVFHIKGAIDASSYDRFEVQANEALETGSHHLLLDLAEVAYISSAGLRAIHSIFTMLRSKTPDVSDEAISKGLRDGTFKSPHLKLLNPSPAVLKVLQTVGFHMYLEIYHDFDEAIASF